MLRENSVLYFSSDTTRLQFTQKCYNWAYWFRFQKAVFQALSIKNIACL